MSECTCQNAVNKIKAIAREGITRELMAQLSDKERQIVHLERQVEMLSLDLAIARGDINFGGPNG